MPLQICNAMFYIRNTMQPDWEALRIYALVASTGSMAKAAAELGCSVSTVARRIDGLEQALGLILLHRSQGGAVPTRGGEAILLSIDKGAQSLNQIPRQAKHFARFRDRQPVRLSATETVINDILMPEIGELRKACPDQLIEMESSNAFSSLEFGATDLAIRLSRPEQGDLIAKKLRPIPISLFISSGQLNGRHQDMIKPGEEDLVWIDAGLGDIAENRLIQELGFGEKITMRATSVRALALACRAGQGMAMLPDYMGQEFGLVRIADVSVPARQAWLVHHPETHRDPVMRNVRRWVVACFEKSGSI